MDKIIDIITECDNFHTISIVDEFVVGYEFRVIGYKGYYFKYDFIDFETSIDMISFEEVKETLESLVNNYNDGELIIKNKVEMHVPDKFIKKMIRMSRNEKLSEIL
jgi:hypothetical protein